MNTYSHVLLTWAAARRLRPHRPLAAGLAALGAAMPDIPYVARGTRLVLTQRRRLSRHQLLARLDYYSEPDWKPDLALHSLVPILPTLAVARAAGRSPVGDDLRAFALGWAGHNLVDLATHASDARPHLWPLSRRRLRSPLSYWERGSHAVPLLVVEHTAVVATAAVLWSRPDGGVSARWHSARVRDAARLARTFVQHPRQVGALVPTSQRTVREMLDMTDWQSVRCAVELGAGTGVYTAQLLERVGSDAEVLAFEIDPGLANRLEERFDDSRLTIICDSAERLIDHLNGRTADVVVSALPFTTLPEPVRRRVYASIAEGLSPGGVMLAIQYSAARQSDLKSLFSSVERRRAFHNVPPALLYACRGPSLDANAQA